MIKRFINFLKDDNVEAHVKQLFVLSAFVGGTIVVTIPFIALETYGSHKRRVAYEQEKQEQLIAEQREQEEQRRLAEARKVKYEQEKKRQRSCVEDNVQDSFCNEYRQKLRQEEEKKKERRKIAKLSQAQYRTEREQNKRGAEEAFKLSQALENSFGYRISDKDMRKLSWHSTDVANICHTFNYDDSCKRVTRESLRNSYRIIQKYGIR